MAISSIVLEHKEGSKQVLGQRRAKAVFSQGDCNTSKCSAHTWLSTQALWGSIDMNKVAASSCLARPVTPIEDPMAYSRVGSPASIKLGCSVASKLDSFDCKLSL